MIEKTQIVPIISVIALLLQSVFHINLSADLQNEIATVTSDLFLLGFSIYGIIKDHHAKPTVASDPVVTNPVVSEQPVKSDIQLP